MANEHRRQLIVQNWEKLESHKILRTAKMVLGEQESENAGRAGQKMVICKRPLQQGLQRTHILQGSGAAGRRGGRAAHPPSQGSVVDDVQNIATGQLKAQKNYNKTKKNKSPGSTVENTGEVFKGNSVWEIDQSGEIRLSNYTHINQT